MLTRLVGRVLVVRQNQKDSTQEEWNEILEFLRSRHDDLSRICMLVVTDGGGPTLSQRLEVAQLLGDTHVQVAAVSDSIKVRFAGATIALFQRHYRQYTMNEMDEAFLYLKLTSHETRQVEKALEELGELLDRPRVGVGSKQDDQSSRV